MIGCVVIYKSVEFAKVKRPNAIKRVIREGDFIAKRDIHMLSLENGFKRS